MYEKSFFVWLDGNNKLKTALNQPFGMADNLRQCHVQESPVPVDPPADGSTWEQFDSWLGTLQQTGPRSIATKWAHKDR
jgi:hypothetical protein